MEIIRTRGFLCCLLSLFLLLNVLPASVLAEEPEPAAATESLLSLEPAPQTPSDPLPEPTLAADPTTTPEPAPAVNDTPADMETQEPSPEPDMPAEGEEPPASEKEENSGEESDETSDDMAEDSTVDDASDADDGSDEETSDTDTEENAGAEDGPTATTGEDTDSDKTALDGETAENDSDEETPECICFTDDPAFHATDCPMYSATENPVCFCAEKCVEDMPNVWCDVCGVNGAAACGAGADENGAALDIEPSYTVSIPASVNLNSETGMTVTVSNIANLKEGSNIVVAASSTSGGYLVSGENKIGYTYTPALSFTQEGSQPLAISVNTADVTGKPPGEYSDILNFSYSVSTAAE